MNPHIRMTYAFALILMTGCSSAPRHVTTQVPETSVTSISVLPSNPPTPANIKTGRLDILSNADGDFRAHIWTESIEEYNDCLKHGLPNGPVSLHGTRRYAIRQISLCNEYMGVQNQQIGNLDDSITDFTEAIKTDPSNSTARRLLFEVSRQANKNTKHKQQMLASLSLANTAPRGYSGKYPLGSQSYLSANVHGMHAIPGNPDFSSPYPVVDSHQVGDQVPVNEMGPDGQVHQIYMNSRDVQQQEQQQEVQQAEQQAHHDKLAHDLGYDNPADAPPGLP